MAPRPLKLPAGCELGGHQYTGWPNKPVVIGWRRDHDHRQPFDQMLNEVVRRRIARPGLSASFPHPLRHDPDLWSIAAAASRHTSSKAQRKEPDHGVLKDQNTGHVRINPSQRRSNYHPRRIVRRATPA
jgi:hypothetical protein